MNDFCTYIYINIYRGISRYLMYYSWYLAVSREKKIVCDSTETEKEIEHKSTIMEMRNIVINQERVIEELILEKLYQKETYITFVLLLLCYYYIIIVIQIFLYYIWAALCRGDSDSCCDCG